jgi:putative nucleotidyltransferase with HDIG domain
MHVLNLDRRSEEPAPGRPTYLFSNWREHGQQVANLARDVAQELGLSDGAAARVEKAARYHDIGKSKLPNIFEDLDDQSKALSRSERELLMSHTWLGYRILQNAPNADNWVADAALLHHEWWNGRGDPLGLAQSDIPLVARIVAVADAYSTVVEQRPYASTWHMEDALLEVKQKAGTQLDPECVEALVAMTSRCEPVFSHTKLTAKAVVN